MQDVFASNSNEVVIRTARAIVAGVIGLVVSSSVIAAEPTAGDPDPRPVIYRAMPTSRPVRIDGKLDDAVWRTAPTYRLTLTRADAKKGPPLRQRGTIRLAWGQKHIYVAIDFVDGDLRARGTKDHEHHYKLGDVAELFLRAPGKTGYAELYATPKGHKTCFWFARPGAKIEVKEDFGLRVAAQIQGTLNDASDLDRGWQPEMAVPMKDLMGGAKRPDDESAALWTMLVGRYNYGFGGDGERTELSAAPELSATSFHLVKEYARIEFAEAADRPATP